jgi:predicted metal-dependent hydrolase
MGAHDYKVRESTRALRVSIRVSRRGELEVVIPRGFDAGRVPEIVESHQAWIERRLARVQRELALAEPEPADGRPRIARLRSLRAEIPINYVATGAGRVTVKEHRSHHPSRVELRISGAIEDVGACRVALRRWLRRRAREHLVPRLDSLAAERSFEFAAVSIRLQKTRWGSCSSAGTISLNAKSLFLPPGLVDHLLLHELCHTTHGDHSPSFHAELARHSPGARALERELRRSWHYVPRWADE